MKNLLIAIVAIFGLATFSVNAEDNMGTPGSAPAPGAEAAPAAPAPAKTAKKPKKKPAKGKKAKKHDGHNHDGHGHDGHAHDEMPPVDDAAPVIPD